MKGIPFCRPQPIFVPHVVCVGTTLPPSAATDFFHHALGLVQELGEEDVDVDQSCIPTSTASNVFEVHMNVLLHGRRPIATSVASKTSSHFDLGVELVVMSFHTRLRVLVLGNRIVQGQHMFVSTYCIWKDLADEETGRWTSISQSIPTRGTALI